MGTNDTTYQPGKTIQVNPGRSPKRAVTIGDSSSYAGLLVIPSTGTYGNGVIVATANYGDSNTGEGRIEQLEIPEIHPQSNTPYDKSTVFTAADPAEAVQHVVGESYWVKGSAVTVSRDDKLIISGSGQVKKAIAHTATPLPVHMWVAEAAFTSATWIKAKYLGMVSYFTSA